MVPMMLIHELDIEFNLQQFFLSSAIFSLIRNACRVFSPVPNRVAIFLSQNCDAFLLGHSSKSICFLSTWLVIFLFLFSVSLS